MTLTGGCWRQANWIAHSVAWEVWMVRRKKLALLPIDVGEKGSIDRKVGARTGCPDCVGWTNIVGPACEKGLKYDHKEKTRCMDCVWVRWQELDEEGNVEAEHNWVSVYVLPSKSRPALYLDPWPSCGVKIAYPPSQHVVQHTQTFPSGWPG